MKSPVPFIKPKSYYTSPIKSNVIRDTVVPQIDPTPQPQLIPQDIDEVEPQEDIVEEIPKPKKSKPTPVIPES